MLVRVTDHGVSACRMGASGETMACHPRRPRARRLFGKRQSATQRHRRRRTGPTAPSRLRSPWGKREAGRVQRQPRAHRRRTPRLRESRLQRARSARPLHPGDPARAADLSIRRSRCRSAATGRSRVRICHLGNRRRLDGCRRELHRRDRARSGLQGRPGPRPGLAVRTCPRSRAWCIPTQGATAPAAPPLPRGDSQRATRGM